MASGAGIAMVTLAAPAAGNALQGLRVGPVYEGTIRVEGGTVALLIGGNALAIKPAPALVDGQRVEAQLQRTPEGMQIRLTLAANSPAPPAAGSLPQAPVPSLTNPSPARVPAGNLPQSSPAPNAPPSTAAQPAPGAAAAPPPASTQTSALARMAAEVARSFPLEAGAERLQTLLPRHLPPTQPLVQAAMQVLAARSAAGSDLETMGKAFALAADRGAVLPAVAGFVLAFQVTDAGQSDSWFQAIQRWVEAATKPLEARLAAALRGGGPEGGVDLAQDLRNVLLRARSDPGMTRVLQQEGDLDAFRQAVDRTVERLTGTQAQNLRSFEGHYLFAELPGGDRFARAQLHVLGEGAEKGGREARRHVVLDVSLRRLGDLWLSLSVTGRRCQCVVRVADAAVLPEVAAAGDELAAALEQAGFPGAEVRVMGWDGDRVGALAGVLAANDRLDLDA